MHIDRSDPEYIDAGQLGGCWVTDDLCGCGIPICPGVYSVDPLGPDEFKSDCGFACFILPYCAEVCVLSALVATHRSLRHVVTQAH